MTKIFYHWQSDFFLKIKKSRFWKITTKIQKIKSRCQINFYTVSNDPKNFQFSQSCGYKRNFLRHRSQVDAPDHVDNWYDDILVKNDLNFHDFVSSYSISFPDSSNLQTTELKYEIRARHIVNFYRKKLTIFEKKIVKKLSDELFFPTFVRCVESWVNHVFPIVEWIKSDLIFSNSS